MFVSDNKVSTAKAYFKARLAAQFSDIAIKQMWQAILEVQFGWSPTEQLLNADERLSESDLLAIRKVVNGLLAHEPFQYLIGETLFDGLRIKCDQRALIPRPETEELVHVLSDLNRNFESILDACTGSACLALALKKRFPTACVHATDLSEEALELSRENAAQLQLEITFECADMLQYSASQSYDLIVSNPPYIPLSENVQLKANVRDYEPHMALFVPNQEPLLFYKALVRFATSNLLTQGYLAFEVHEAYAEQVAALFDATFKGPQIFSDLQGKPRMVLAQKL